MTRDRLALVLILLIGLAVRVWGLSFGLPNPMTRPDEEFIVSMAMRFFSGDYNPHFFEWPSLYFYIVHAVFRGIYAVGHMTGAYPDPQAFAAAVRHDPTLAHISLRVMSLAAGLATIAVVHGMTARMLGRRVALGSAALLALAYLHVRDSHFGVLDVPLTLLIVSTVSVLTSVRPTSLRRFAVAGLLAGVASSIKYNAAALAVPAFIAGALLTEPLSSRTLRRAFVAWALFAAVFALAFVAGSPYTVLDFDAFREGMTKQVARLTEGHGVAIDRVWYRHLTFSLWHGVGFPVLMVAMLGTIGLFVSEWRKAIVLFSFPIAYLIVIGSGHTAFIRYTTPLVPFLCIAAAWAFNEVVERALASRPLRDRTLGFAIVLGLAVAPSVATVVAFNRMLTRTDSRLLAADWLRDRIVPGAVLYESGASYARPHYSWPEGEVPYVQAEFDQRQAVFTTDAGKPATPDWIVLAESPLRLYTPVAAPLRGLLAGQYDLVQTFEVTREPEPESWFDRQDAFFLPYADFSRRERPGPRLSIHKLRR